MAGASKRRAAKEAGAGGSTRGTRQSNTTAGQQDSPSSAGAQRPSPNSPPRFDGPPKEPTPAGRSAPTSVDVRNISEAIGMAGWALARGIANCPHISFSFRSLYHLNTILDYQTLFYRLHLLLLSYHTSNHPYFILSLSTRYLPSVEVMAARAQHTFRNLDIRINNVEQFKAPGSLPARPPVLNSNGYECVVKLNSFGVANMPAKAVYQYDIVVNKGDEKRGLVKKVWASKTIQHRLAGWLFDGNKLAWSLDLHAEMLTITVDLDAEQGRTVRPGGRSNKHNVFIKKTKTLKFDTLEHYMNGKGAVAFDSDCLEAINFLDHLMREYPSQLYTKIKRSFFPPSSNAPGRIQLGNGVEAFKGVYSSMRVVNRPEPMKLAVNVDVANGTFWTAMKLEMSILQVMKYRNTSELQANFAHEKNSWDRSRLKRELKRYSRVSVVTNHRGGPSELFTIDKFIAQSAQEKKFEMTERNDAGDIIKREWVTYAQYFKRKYNITLTTGLPLIKTTKKDVYLPLDVLSIPPNQRYAFKLDEKQTSNMIKFAVTLPRQRWDAIQDGVNMLKWNLDPYLIKFNVKINPDATRIKARVLPAPDLKFAGSGKVGSGECAKGRWRIDDLKFLYSNVNILKSWGICVVQGRGGVDKTSVQQFMSNFIRIYEKHGGRIDPGSKQPPIELGNLAQGGEMITTIWNTTGNRFQVKPQILIFIVPDRNADTYNRIKKSCECRYGIPSQVMQASHVQQNKPQYISNVLMKVNAKLGGATSLAVPSNIDAAKRNAQKNWGQPTMCIGADVSHPAPGSQGGSYAALTVSLNLQCTRYAAQVNTNGHRVEMITTSNFDQHLYSMFNWWVQNVGGGRVPQRVFYFRDGVSEGQYAHVLEQEVRDMKQVFKKVAPNSNVKVTVIVASKRHHIRFFPETRADRNGNPQPGTLVETGVTHPFEFDFYLNAHSAIKGTARPVHYHVLLNEAGVHSAELQQYIFEHSFQYARSTTPVSIFPAVYYAHLASQRARAHENTPAVSSGKKETQAGGTAKPPGVSSASDKTQTEVPPLIPMNQSSGLQYSMWYI
ncbi:Piwi-domain-containing protein [Pseudovirgaria hyperparasitica]|uniref:Piwi-domain-containing protein n=1 Tax=Pseudovirgaria hyperparasitica TaxID=470096 RepID=A0A6A6WDT5_9PEZI|nr:Piwi-domain-containing protein [Pseudovirgaria hyperparasitica]KAF2760873.1 Piwi-domain-containing protein [Pseudovirgaria hyperparasitica]